MEKEILKEKALELFSYIVNELYEDQVEDMYEEISELDKILRKL